MATRYADLKFRVTGGDQLQREIKAVNAELTKLKSQTSLAKAEFAGMANTEAALQKQTDLLEQQLDALNRRLTMQTKYEEDARKELERVTQARDDNKKVLDAVQKAYNIYQKTLGDTHPVVQALKKRLDELTSSQNVLDKAVAEGTRKTENAGAAVAKTSEEIANTKTVLSKFRSWLEEAKNSADKTSHSINEYGEEVHKSGDAIEALGLAIMASGVKQGLKEIKDAMVDCINASATFEAALTGVAKTTSMSGQTLVDFGEALKEMSTRIPMSAASLAEIAQMAGQLGIADENIKDFTETIAALSVSTNIVGSEGAEALARFMNIMKTSQGDVDRLGAAIVDLGNNFATTENEILQMAMNLAGAGKQAGLTEADVLGIATAISSVGIAAGKGGTAFSKALINMQLAVATGSEKLQDFAEIAGMTGEEFAQLFNDNTIEAVQRFFVGLGNGSKPAIELLTEMGVSEVRLRDTMLRLSNATDLFTGAIARSNEAYDANVALIHEANLFYGTAQSQTELLKNAFENLKIAVGDALNPALNNLKKTGIDVLKVATDFIKANPGLVRAIVVIVSALGTLAAAITAISVASKLWKSVQEALNIVLLSNPYMAVATALAALVGILAACALKTEETNERVKELNSSFDAIVEGQRYMTDSFNSSLEKMDATRSVAEEYLNILAALEEQSSLTEQEQRIYNDTVEKLKDLYPDLEIEIDETTGLIKNGTEALREQIDTWEESARAAAYAEYVKQMAKAVTEAEIELRTTEIKLKNASDDLASTRSDRVDIEKQLLEQMGYHVDSIEQLTEKQYDDFMQTVELNEATRELYERWKALQDKEKDLQTKVQDLTQAVSDQKDGLVLLQQDLDITKQAISETSDEFVKGAEKVSSTDTYSLGSQAAAGAVRGVRDRIGDYASAWEDMALAGQRMFRRAEQIASPSKVYKQLAMYDVEGLIEGTQEEKQRLEEAYANLALRGQEAYASAAQNITNNSNATMNIYTTDLSRDKIDYIYDEFNRRLNRV